MLSLTLIAGQLVGAILLDAVFPAGRDLTTATYIGAGLTLLAVALASARGSSGAVGRVCSLPSDRGVIGVKGLAAAAVHSERRHCLQCIAGSVRQRSTQVWRGRHRRELSG